MGDTRASQWRVGLTHELAARKIQWSNEGKDTTHWTAWEADSLGVAQAVEAHFIAQGMDGGPGGSLDNRKKTYVYIF